VQRDIFNAVKAQPAVALPAEPPLDLHLNRNFRFEPAIPARFLDQTALFGKGFIRFSSMVLSTAPELVDLASRGHATP